MGDLWKFMFEKCCCGLIKTHGRASLAARAFCAIVPVLRTSVLSLGYYMQGLTPPACIMSVLRTLGWM